MLKQKEGLRFMRDAPFCCERRFIDGGWLSVQCRRLAMTQVFLRL